METKVPLSNEGNSSKRRNTRSTHLYSSALASTSPPSMAKLTQKYKLKAGQACSRPSWASRAKPDGKAIPIWPRSRTQWGKASSKTSLSHRLFKIATSIPGCTQYVKRQRAGDKEDRHHADAIPSPVLPVPLLWGFRAWLSLWRWPRQGWKKNHIWFSHCRFSLKTQKKKINNHPRATATKSQEGKYSSGHWLNQQTGSMLPWRRDRLAVRRCRLQPQVGHGNPAWPQEKQFPSLGLSFPHQLHDDLENMPVTQVSGEKDYTKMSIKKKWVDRAQCRYERFWKICGPPSCSSSSTKWLLEAKIDPPYKGSTHQTHIYLDHCANYQLLSEARKWYPVLQRGKNDKEVWSHPGARKRKGARSLGQIQLWYEHWC